MKAKKAKKHYCNITKKIPDEFPIFYSLELDKKGREYLKFNPGNYELLTCDGLIGFHVDTYAKKVRPWAKKVIKHYKNKKR